MGSKKKKSPNLREYFEGVKLVEWEVTGSLAGGGQSDILKVRNLNDKKKLGVFRKLRSQEEKDIKRFFRELSILTKTDHPNVVKLLDYTTNDETWYISELGTPFETYWKIFLKKNEADPDTVLKEGIRIIRELANGLCDLHDQGIVHRDIKPKNVVVIENQPTLIDFGIAFVTGEERFTNPDEAMANVFSPDPALNFMHEVPPWLDVFLLSQLLIWMVSEGHNKPNAARPLDWRWVLYPKFSAGNLQKVKAITGLCSNYFTSPQNAREFIQLIDFLFNETKPMTNSSDKDKLKLVKKAIQEGYSTQYTNFAEARQVIEARLSLFIAICQEIEDGVLATVKDLESDLTFTPMEDSHGIEGFSDQFENNSNDKLLATYSGQLGYAIGDGLYGFGTSIRFLLRTAKGVENDSRFQSWVNRPYLQIHLNDSQKLHESGKTQNYYVTVSDTGTLTLLNWGMEEIREVTTSEVVQMVRDSIIDPEVWKISGP